MPCLCGPQPMMDGSWWVDTPVSSLLRDNSEACSQHLPQVPGRIEFQVLSAAFCSLVHPVCHSFPSFSHFPSPDHCCLVSKTKLFSLTSLSQDVSGKKPNIITLICKLVFTHPFLFIDISLCQALLVAVLGEFLFLLLVPTPRLPPSQDVAECLAPRKCSINTC